MPLRMESVFTKVPWANAALISIISLVSIFALTGVIPIEDVEEYVLRDWDLRQMIGNTFLHANLFHLVGNMLFLWIFGNAICATIGNTAYPFVYFFLAIVASATQLLWSEVQGIGASGAIYGIIGMSLVLFPTNRIQGTYLFFILPLLLMLFFLSLYLFLCFVPIIMMLFYLLFKKSTFVTKTYWMILYFIVFENIIPVLMGGSGVGYGAHLGGFGAGVFTGILLLLFDAVETYDPTLAELLTGQRTERDTYDIDELKEIDTRRTKATAQEAAFAASIDPMGTDAAVNPAMVTEIGYQSDPTPVFRVLNCIKKESFTTVFFVNDGDGIGQVEVETASPGFIEFQPLRDLSKRATGWMKLQGFDPSQLQELRFSLSYDVGTGYRLKKEFSYDSSQKKFLAG
jgi:membrane associated rhomboid family serine protease